LEALASFPQPLLRALDLFFLVLHGAVILLCILGWIWRGTRILGLALIGATGASWYILGPLLGYGTGYCFLTHWHREVLFALGASEVPISFTALFIERVTGLEPEPALLEVVIEWTFGLAAIAFIALLVRDRAPRIATQLKNNVARAVRSPRVRKAAVATVAVAGIWVLVATVARMLQPSPADTVDRYLEAFVARDADTLTELLSDGAVRAVEGDLAELREDVDQAVRLLEQDGVSVGHEVVEELDARGFIGLFLSSRPAEEISDRLSEGWSMAGEKIRNGQATVVVDPVGHNGSGRMELELTLDDGEWVLDQRPW